MKFRAKFSTDDGRLTNGREYRGGFVWKRDRPGNPDVTIKGGLRIVVFDDKGDWTTFEPRAFMPFLR